MEPGVRLCATGQTIGGGSRRPVREPDQDFLPISNVVAGGGFVQFHGEPYRDLPLQQQQQADHVILDDEIAYDYDKELSLESDSDGETEDLDDTIQSLQKLTYSLATKKVRDGVELLRKPVTRKPEVIDDFFRNFLVKMGLMKTLDSFEKEWFELKERGRFNERKLGRVPDEYIRSMQLEESLLSLRQQLHQANHLAQCRQEMLEKLRKERNIHRMHHRRLSQEKNKLIVDVKRLRRHFAQYDPLIRELKRRYDIVTRQKSLLTLERDKLQALVSEMPQSKHGDDISSCDSKQKRNFSMKQHKLMKNGSLSEIKRYSTGKHANLRPDPLSLQYPSNDTDLTPDPIPAQHFKLQKTFRGHSMPISCVAIHPKKPVIATSSDDTTWRMWGLPEGDLIMTGDGHKDWVAGLDFHPRGLQLASSSGDCTVKIWSFEKARCIQTFTDHTQAIWSVAYHGSGEILASASLDHTARIWDLISLKCRGTLRGHVDSVNSITWKPDCGILCSASSDKTVSLWDGRSTLCVQTFYGHQASCSHAAFDPKGNLVASSDSSGIVKIWDIRKVTQLSTINTGPASSNKCAFDRSGRVLSIASSDNSIKCFLLDLEVIPLAEFHGHDDAVLSVVFDPAGKFLVSGSTDCTFRIWA